ncbi:hypothetical protein [Burkholderia cenocepacia]|uniref:hypothetical protein n=1 Tax=Burkholderia cenocepacia TaxID=95486 RepID=UPI002650FC40|nr:hypothetical protein [Burkholderia cenocepacia]MDN7678458.1 hypothetical protein [Burkholderia cenocepacia]
MPRAERPDGSPARQPKPSWGPGKNAALSVAAFAAIFGAFAYVERDTRVGHANQGATQFAIVETGTLTTQLRW